MEFAVPACISWVPQNKLFVSPALIFPSVKLAFNVSHLTMGGSQGPKSIVLLMEHCLCFQYVFLVGLEGNQADSFQVHDVPSEPQDERDGESTVSHGKWHRGAGMWPSSGALPSMSKALGLSPSPQEEEESTGTPEGRSQNACAAQDTLAS